MTIHERTPPPIVITTLTRVQQFAATQGVTCYLVGGLLRDQLLGREPASMNIDLAVARNALEVSQALAAHLRAAYVPLDEAAGSARVVVDIAGERMELDLSDFRGSTLDEDLRRRDFTANAMAIALEEWLRAPHDLSSLIDPLNGRSAIAHQQLIPCFTGTFDEDPIRILRAFRFAAQLHFTIDVSAHPLMAKASSRLASVSGERIRDELLAIFQTDAAHPAIRSLNDLGAIDAVFPELSPGRGLDQGGFHHLDVLGHQLETVAQADRFLTDFAEFSTALREPLARYCAQQFVERRSRKGLIKLAGLLHDVGKPTSRQVHPDGEIWFIGHELTGEALATTIVERLKLSNEEATMVCQMVRHHLRPGFLSREPQLTRRAVYRFFKELGENGPACLLTWWADRMATRGSQSRLDQIGQQRNRLEELLNAYFFHAEEVVRPPKLVNGHQLMETFRLEPGPVVGELLAMIEEAQAEGRAHSSEEALRLAGEHLKQQRSS